MYYCYYYYYNDLTDPTCLAKDNKLCSALINACRLFWFTRLTAECLSRYAYINTSFITHRLTGRSHVYTGNVCWCAVKDQHQQDNKRAVLHDVQYKSRRICCLSTWTVWPITERHLRSHDFSLQRLDLVCFVNQTKWEVAAMYHLCDDLDHETNIKVWTRPNKMIFACRSPCMLSALMWQTVSELPCTSLSSLSYSPHIINMLFSKWTCNICSVTWHIKYMSDFFWLSFTPVWKWPPDLSTKGQSHISLGVHSLSIKSFVTFGFT